MPTRELLAGCSLLCLLTACGKDADEAATPRTPAAVSARVDTVTLDSFTEAVEGVGAIVPRIGHVALLAAPSPTRITRIHVAVGDHVAEGAALVDFEQATYDAAVNSAEAALRSAEQASARATRLVEAGISPRKDAEVAAAELENAKLNAVTARRARDLSHIRAPFAGVVTRLSAAVGANVDVGQPLVEVTDPSALDILVPVAPADASGIRAGQSVELYEGNGAAGQPIGRARVADVSAVVDSASRGVPVRLTLLSGTRALRIGESIFTRILVAQHRNVVVIADDALVPSGEAYHVFVVDSAGVAHSRDVTVGGRAAHRLWITEGLAAGDRVVTTGAFGMDEGAKVIGGKP